MNEVMIKLHCLYIDVFIVRVLFLHFLNLFKNFIIFKKIIRYMLKPVKLHTLRTFLIQFVLNTIKKLIYLFFNYLKPIKKKSYLI